MENVILIVHLILALSLIGLVLLQRSEGGGLGMGGGGGAVSAGRSTANAMTKLTWILAVAFICTSIAMTIIAAKNSSGASVLDRIDNAPAEQPVPALPDAGNLTLPPAVTDAPLTPPPAE